MGSRQIDQVIQRAASLGIRGPSSRGEYKVCCPFCPSKIGRVDTLYKLQLNKAKGVYYCYRCESKGRTNLDWIAGPVVVDQSERPIPVLPPEFVGFVGNEASVALAPYRTYLQKRNLWEASLTIKAGACLTGKYAGRVIVPHRLKRFTDLGEEVVVGFAARAIMKGVEPRYLYPPGMDRKTHLFGEAFPLTEDLWIVEGPLDALALYPEAVACFGKAVTDEQMDLVVSMAKMHREIIVCLDGDAWEEGRILSVQLYLRGCENVRWCKLPPGEDPGSLGQKVKEFLLPNEWK